VAEWVAGWVAEWVAEGVAEWVVGRLGCLEHASHDLSTQQSCVGVGSKQPNTWQATGFTCEWHKPLLVRTQIRTHTSARMLPSAGLQVVG